MHTLFYFIVAIGVLVSFHEFGHFWVARKLGVKVLRFSIGFGKVIWSYRKNSADTEYVVSSIPLGGYVKMLDEREGEVKAEELPYAFNRQPLLSRVAIVGAGPLFNLILAVLLIWIVLMLGETGFKPVLGKIDTNSLAAQAGLNEGEEVLAVNNQPTATWNEMMEMVFSSAMESAQNLTIETKTVDDSHQVHTLNIPEELRQEPEKLLEKLGMSPWMPEIPPVVGAIIEGKPAAIAGLHTGDVIISADQLPIKTWLQWVDYVQKRPGVPIELAVERDQVLVKLTITPEKLTENNTEIGKIGAAVKISDDIIKSLQVTHALSPWPAFTKALSRTAFYCQGTLKMMGQMLIGQASVKNLSGPISIAQFAGISAERGMVEFLSFLAKISISLGVLNLLPIPVLDGGHLLFYAIEAVKGNPVSEKLQVMMQQVGMLLLLALMVLAIFLDLERLFQ